MFRARRLRAAHLGLLLTLAGSVSAQEPSAFRWQLEPLAEGVYAAIQPEDEWVNDSNSLVVVSEHEVLVVDSQADPARTQALIEWIAELTPLPIRFVVNTHWHSDHTQNNSLYRDQARGQLEILGHHTLVADIAERAGKYIADEVERLDELLPRAKDQLAAGRRLDGEPLTEEQKVSQRAAIDREQERLQGLRKAQLLTPTWTYARKLTLFLGQREIQLLHLPGHTRGDTVVYLPREKLLATGDLLDVMPYVGHGNLSQWSRSLALIDQLDFDTIVPGHGPVFRGREQLDKLSRFFGELRAHTQRAVAEGWNEDEASQQLELEPLRNLLAGDNARLRRIFDTFASEAAARARAEARELALEELP